MNGHSNSKRLDPRLATTLWIQFAGAFFATALTTAVALVVWGYAIGRDVAVQGAIQAEHTHAIQDLRVNQQELRANQDKVRERVAGLMQFTGMSKSEIP